MTGARQPGTYLTVDAFPLDSFASATQAWESNKHKPERKKDGEPVNDTPTFGCTSSVWAAVAVGHSKSQLAENKTD